MSITSNLNFIFLKPRNINSVNVEALHSLTRSCVLLMILIAKIRRGVRKMKLNRDKRG